MGIANCCEAAENPKIKRTNSHIDNHSVESLHTLQKYFPGSISGFDTDNLIGPALEARGFTASNTLYTDSSCPDEINHNDPEEDITSIFQTRWGEIFPLGGLAGLPFTGKTGWHAFSSHCPKDGNIILLFAPHVGVDSSGNVGTVKRDGQDFNSAACGAAIGALKTAQSDPKNCIF